VIGPEDVYFYVNGPSRLIQATVIAEELYAANRKHLILLHQYGYDYTSILPHVRHRYVSVHEHVVSNRKYSPLDQWMRTYLDPQLHLRRILKPQSRVILFGIRSPSQKFIVRQSRRLGNAIDVYAESLSVDRYFRSTAVEPVSKVLARRVFPRAFDFQHEYDTFHVMEPWLYRDSPHAGKLRRRFNMYGSASFDALASLLTRDVELQGLQDFDTVFLGQPLSNFESFLQPAEEEQILHEVIGEDRVLVLPHPNERLEPGEDKYRGLPNVRVFRSGVSSELLLSRLRPLKTVTYYSTAGVNYAAMNPESENLFFPIHRSMYELLDRLRMKLPNMHVSRKYLVGDDPYGSPRRSTTPVPPSAPRGIARS